MSRFIWVAGPEPRTMHIADCDRLGREVGALCGADLPFDRSCNLPLGQPICAACREVSASIEESAS